MKTLLVFLKYPAAGRVKTRLAESIGDGRAAQLYREWIGIVLANVQIARRIGRLVACYDGAPQGDFQPWHDLADHWWPQPAGALGQRLDAAFDRWQTPGQAAVAIGTDCLDVDSTCIQAAFDSLAQNDAVFGPSHDGGYYLVGMRSYLPGFFEGIPWSSPTTLAAHQSHCRNSNWSFALLPTFHDIDTFGDLQNYERRSGKRA